MKKVGTQEVEKGGGSMDGPIWERLPGESAKAYEAFCIYRDLPPHERSLKAVAEKLGGKRSGKSRALRPLERWSSRYRWVERAAAWDEEQDRQARAAQLEAIKEMRERHAREAMMLQKKAIERLNSMDPRELSAADVLRFLIEAAKLERLARGEPETIQEHRNEWVDAVLAAWQQRLSKAKDAHGEGKPST